MTGVRTPGCLVDSSVLLDVFTDDPTWGSWSAQALADAADTGTVAINPIVYAEIAAGFTRIEDLDAALPSAIERLPLPWEAGFLASRLFVAYRRAGGAKRSPLPDFYIGAHAAVAGMTLLTRDARRFRAQLPRLTIVSP